MDWSYEVLMFNNMQSPVYVLLFSGIDLYNYRKVMFSHASVHGWMDGYVWSLVPGYRRYTTRRYSPQKVTSPERYAAQKVHPSGRYTPTEGTPLQKVHPSGRCTSAVLTSSGGYQSGWYASYWNISVSH